MTSPRTALKQALLTSPRPSVRPSLSAAKPPLRGYSQGLENTPRTTKRNGEQNERNGSCGDRNTNGTAFAQLRCHLESLRLTGERARGSYVLATEVVPDKKGAEPSVTTPLAGGVKRATTFLSPALLWTPSEGPSPSLDKLRERLAGMAGN